MNQVARRIGRPLGRGYQPLKVVRLLRKRISRQGLRRPGARNLDAHRRLGLVSGLAQHGKRRQRFVVNLCNQKGFPVIVLLPDLADLHLPSAHSLNLDTIPRRVNNLWICSFQPPSNHGKLFAGYCHRMLCLTFYVGDAAPAGCRMGRVPARGVL